MNLKDTLRLLSRLGITGTLGTVLHVLDAAERLLTAAKRLSETIEAPNRSLPPDWALQVQELERSLADLRQALR